MQKNYRKSDACYSRLLRSVIERAVEEGEGSRKKFDLKLTLTIFFKNICEFRKISDIDTFQARRPMILMRDNTESKLFSLKEDTYI